MATKKISFGRPSQTAKTSTPSQAEMDAWVSAGAEAKVEQKTPSKAAQKESMKRVIIEIDEETHRKIKALCAHYGCSMSRVLRAKITEIIELAPEEILENK